MIKFIKIVNVQIVLLICLSGCSVGKSELGTFSRSEGMADSDSHQRDGRADADGDGVAGPDRLSGGGMGGMGMEGRRRAGASFGAAGQTSLAEFAAQNSKAKSAERILIYEAGLDISVSNIEESLSKVQLIANEAGGYLDTMTSKTIVIRVPAKKFFDILEQLKKLGQIIDKSIEVQDVTELYIDLKLRLENAEALRKRLLSILDKAKEVKDMLAVEKELNRIREEIERLKGQLVSMEKRVSFSTIAIEFIQAREPKVVRHRPQNPFAWLDRLGVENVLLISR